MKVQLRDEGDGHLIGTLGDEPVEWQVRDPETDEDRRARRRCVSGRFGAADLEASWTMGDNYVPGPGGWTPSPDYVSDFPNIPAHLSGSFGDLDAELHAVFHLDAAYGFQRGSIVGRIGVVHLEATVLKATGGLSDGRTAAVEGTYGPMPFNIFGTIDGGLTQGSLHGKIAAGVVQLDFVRPSLQRSPRHGPRVDAPRPRISVSGSYGGPPELLAVMVGAMLKFL